MSVLSLFLVLCTFKSSFAEISVKDPDFVVTDVELLVTDSEFSVSMKCATRAWLLPVDEDYVEEILTFESFSTLFESLTKVCIDFCPADLLLNAFSLGCFQMKRAW